MEKVPHIVHQGDVLLIEVNPSPQAKPEPVTYTASGEREVVMALGETSGHRHTIRSERIAHFRDDGCGYGSGAKLVTLDAPAKIEHLHGDQLTLEHGTIALRGGTTYLYETQSQWTDEMEPIQVAD